MADAQTCPVCTKYLYRLLPRCECNGTNLRDEIVRLREEVDAAWTSFENCEKHVDKLQAEIERMRLALQDAFEHLRISGDLTIVEAATRAREALEYREADA